jgi:transposase-like protein
MEKESNTLQSVIVYFSIPVNCREYVVRRRWPNGVTCPVCGSEQVKLSEKYNRWQCSSRHARRQFTMKTGTIFEDSPLGLDKWLTAVWVITNDKDGISSSKVARALGVTRKTALFMLRRIRKAMQLEPFIKLAGEVEVDETFIGGKARNMHVAQRQRRITGTGGKDKTVVTGILEGGGKIRTTVVENRNRRALQAGVKKRRRWLRSPQRRTEIV